MNNKVSILSTVSLDPPLINLAMSNDIMLDAISFIAIETIKDETLQKKLESYLSQQLTVAFTSANAVRAIGEVIGTAKPNWNIYCIGNATKIAALDHFEPTAIKDTANSAAALAEKIIAAGIKHIVFFCGDKRLDTLPEFLRAAKTEVDEVVVYKTTHTPQVVTKHYHGILFLSPSSVHSFFEVNKVAPDMVLFAIGNTTAAAVTHYTNNKVVISATPSKEEMVAGAMHYFHTQVPVALAQKHNNNE